MFGTLQLPPDDYCPRAAWTRQVLDPQPGVLWRWCSPYSGMGRTTTLSPFLPRTPELQASPNRKWLAYVTGRHARARAHTHTQTHTRKRAHTYIRASAVNSRISLSIYVLMCALPLVKSSKTSSNINTIVNDNHHNLIVPLNNRTINWIQINEVLEVEQTLITAVFPSMCGPVVVVFQN